MSVQTDITAIIYDKRGRVLSIGKNSYIKTHPLQAKFAKKTHEHPKKVYLHAEMAAIVKCKNLDKAHRMVIIRLNKKGEGLNCKPCPACEEALRSMTSIKHIEHT